ncbi:LysR family transcriptional regulator [Mycobacterium sp. 3519A]|jgi:DNA-binding transcriptional LysR family regulator|uniref:LysR family transcriptional regulator n=1 Tax=Mycobacterium sp. 3519A TaxID=2057184 RepID=UPI000C7D8DCC|nr:LysR family transcriptional regulator [Mycobacterium sp. 3519A]
MELRQLRYFVAVAEELHYGRAAERLHISGPALSQQIIALERELGAELFVRDRRSVALTDAGRSLLDDARRMLALAEDARQRLRRTATEATPLRMGYVSWLPDDITALLAPTAPVRVDEWVLPSHAQADRVAEGSLDLAIAWVDRIEAETRGLAVHLVRAEPLHAVRPGSAMQVPAARVTVLTDPGGPTWSSWNRFIQQFAVDTGARAIPVEDGGITGDAFYAHVRRLRVPVLESPKRHTSTMPPRLGQCEVTDPVPLWTWSLLHRAHDDRPAIAHVVESVIAFAESRNWRIAPAGDWWVPAGDPHRTTLGP